MKRTAHVAGSPMHRLVATVHCRDEQAAVAAVAAARADWVELRLDALWPAPPDAHAAARLLEAATAAAKAPLLATLRPQRQGGHFVGDEAVRVGLLEAAARSGLAGLDVENDLQAMVPLLAHLGKATRKIALSNHLAQAPEKGLGERHLTAMQDLAGMWQKLSFPAPALPQVLRAMELAALHARRGGRPALAPTAPADAMHRAALALAGNHVTYGAASRDAAAPGQCLLADVQATWAHWGIDRQDLDGCAKAPGWYAVLGDPVAHSLSPAIHNAAFRLAGLPQRFGALVVPAAPGMLRLALTAAPRIGLLGASVTAPHKVALLDVAQPDAIASEVGAANCVYGKDQVPHCTNTDATALERILAPWRHEGGALVVGAGGVARAALWALGRLGVDAAVTARRDGLAEEVATRAGAAWVPWGGRMARRAAIVIQATSAPAGQARLAPLSGCSVLVETRYAQGTTAVEEEALAAGVRTVGATRLLLEQAMDAWRVWMGKEPDRGAMEAALAARLPTGNAHAVAATEGAGP